MDIEVKAYIEKQKSPQKEITRRLRKIILETFPGISEELKWGVPVYGRGRYYIGALKEHVNLGFSINGLPKKDIGNFEGRGSTMRHIKIRSVKDIDRERVVRLLKIVKGRCKSC